MSGEKLGSIRVDIYKDKPHEVKLSGKIRKSDLELARRFINKEYKSYIRRLQKQMEGSNVEEHTNSKSTIDAEILL